MVLRTRRIAHELLSIIRVVALVFMTWKALAWAADCPTPLVVVTSESMEPNFQRGDILLLWNRTRYIGVGEVAVLAFPSRKLPMVHRVVESYFLSNNETGSSSGPSQYILTKGDNNEATDALLYPNDLGLAPRQNVAGLVRCIVPLLGLPVIKLNEWLARPTKYVL